MFQNIFTAKPGIWPSLQKRQDCRYAHNSSS